MFTMTDGRQHGEQQTRPPRLRRTSGGSLPRRLGAAALAAVPIMALGVALATPASADTPATITTILGYTGGQQAFTVPAGVASLNLTLDGGGGGTGGSGGASNDGFAGGAAGEVTGTVQVRPGDQLHVFVGQAGSSYSGYTYIGGGGTGDTARSLQGGSGGGDDIGRGGGGGAATDVYLNSADGTGALLAVAGGGGGGGGGGGVVGYNGGSGGAGTGQAGGAGKGLGAGGGGAGGGGSTAGVTANYLQGGHGGGGGGGYPLPGTGGSAGGVGNGGGGGGGGGDSSADHLGSARIGISSRGAGVDGSLTISYLTPSVLTVASANPAVSTQGQPVTYSASVRDPAGVTNPTGTVSFSVGSTVLCTTTALVPDPGIWAAGRGSCTASNAPLGRNTVQVSYSGDGTFPKNSQTSTTETVQSAGFTVAGSANPSSPAAGDTVSYSATVTPKYPAAEIPGGTVKFFVGNTTLCTATVNSAGTATCSASTAPAGDDIVIVAYDGGSAYVPTRAIFHMTVSWPTTTVLTANTYQSAEGDLVKYTATVRTVSGTVVPTGTVTFTVGGAPLCNRPITLDGTGQAECKSTRTPLGISNTVTATYSGGGPTFRDSAGTVEETVSARTAALGTSTTVTANPPASTLGDPVTYLATVQTSPGKTIPTGTVSFTVGTTKLCTAAVALNGVGNAKCVSPRAPLGTDTVTATYQPADASFVSSAGQTIETVTAPAKAASAPVGKSPAR